MATRKEHNSRPRRSGSQLCRPTTRARIYLRDGYRCVWCGQAVGGGDLSLDHLIPRSAGGSNRFWNLATAHKSCNARRRDRGVLEFASAFGFEAPAIALRVLACMSTPLPVPAPRVAVP